VRVLFIGGTGVISSACSRECLDKGMELWLMSRGQSLRSLPEGARHIPADIRNEDEIRAALRNMTFDAVADWVAFETADVERDVRLFEGRTGQYIFISSASAYKKPLPRLPVTEDMPLGNPLWPYAQKKAECEEWLVRAFRDRDFPVTIVRPSHTYDPATVPLRGGYTAIRRIQQGKKIILHGDGNSLWTLTHHRDFARGFVPLIGHPKAVGEAFHITSDEALTWNEIVMILAESAGCKAEICHVPVEKFDQYDREWSRSVLGDKMHSLVFDNRKIKRIAPEFQAQISFRQGAREIMQWFDAHPQYRQTDARVDLLMDRMVEESNTP